MARDSRASYLPFQTNVTKEKGKSEVRQSMRESLSCREFCTISEPVSGKEIGSAGREKVTSETRVAPPSLAPGMRSSTGVPYEDRRRGPRAAAAAPAPMSSSGGRPEEWHALERAVFSRGGNVIELAGRAETRKERRRNPERNKPAGPLVLIVDADAALCRDVKDHLAACGYEVTVLHSAGEARAALSAFTPALVITDLEGEERPGYELCARMKATPRLQHVPVMLLTYSAHPRDYARARSLGAVVCMAKPFDVERLGHVVQLLVPVARGS